MPNKGDVVGFECRVAKHMIGMNVAVDDVANRLAGGFLNHLTQQHSHFHAAARIQRRDTFFADDKTDVRLVAQIGRRALGDHLALVHKNTRRDFF